MFAHDSSRVLLFAQQALVPRVSYLLGWQPPWRRLVCARSDGICTHAFGMARLCPAHPATLQDCRPVHTSVLVDAMCRVCVGCTAGGVSHGQPAPPQLHRLCGCGGHPTLRHHRILQVGATAAGGRKQGMPCAPRMPPLRALLCMRRVCRRAKQQALWNATPLACCTRGYPHCFWCRHPAPSLSCCSRGSLFDVLRGARHNPARAAELNWARRLHMALDAAKGMVSKKCVTRP